MKIRVEGICSFSNSRRPLRESSRAASQDQFMKPFCDDLRSTANRKDHDKVCPGNGRLVITAIEMIAARFVRPSEAPASFP